MTLRSWIHRLFARTHHRSRKPGTLVSGRNRGFRPWIDLLENRTLLKRGTGK